ncbi:hypothetical protein K445DRAFT_309101 [Daldinia sp. EC12]|nr:hypothetical protein K445DRAFT_309101 [Daldinia sp. EC12]
MEGFPTFYPLNFRIEALDQVRNGQWLLIYVVILTAIVGILYFLQSRKDYDDGLFIANKRFSWEPAYFGRLRWISDAQQILNAADIQAQGRPYRLSRGDTDQIILPPSMIHELNGLGMDVLNSRESHAFGLLGHLTGMDVVRKTSFHVRVLLSYVSPALPRLFALTGARISARIENEFPQSEEWALVKPSNYLLTYFHEIVFKVCFAMRCVPQYLQPLLVWLLPAKWRLISGWRKLRGYVVPRVLQLKEANRNTNNKDSSDSNPDVISWMVKDGRNEMERDPDVLTTLVGSIAAGSTYSITNFCCRVIADMVAHPDVLDAVCTEIREKNAQIHGQWDMASLASLEKLESAMKESSRLTPGTLLVYSRVVKKDHVLSNGLPLKKGQFVTISSSMRTADPAIFENPQQYKGLRFCDDGRAGENRAQPFSSIDTNTLTWGAGRWSCPGRLITDMSAKILLVKLLHEYEFAFVSGQPLPISAMHEFLFFHPENQMLARLRKGVSKITFI